jgi:hypothetical protein
MNKYYAGIGSRETPMNICKMMSNIAHHLNSKGYTLRSGGASGADNAFDVDNIKKIIYLPWNGFGNHTVDGESYIVPKEIHTEMVYKYHPSKFLKPAVMKLMSRNVNQVLGEDLKTPVDFIVCWTKDGLEIGGTAMAIRIAKDFKIPVYNFGNKTGAKDFKEYLNITEFFVV